MKHAGLPNITGTAKYQRATGNDDYGFNINRTSGALYGMELGNTINDFAGTASTGANTIGFDASRSNPIYGSSTTVQLPSIKLIPQLRY